MQRCVRVSGALIAPPALRVSRLGPGAMFRGYVPVAEVRVWRKGEVRVTSNAEVREMGFLHAHLPRNRKKMARVDGTLDGLEVTMPWGTQLVRARRESEPGRPVAHLYERARFNPRRRFARGREPALET